MEDAYRAGNPDWNGSDRLVVLSGCSGGGKSTLLAELARRGHRVFAEPGRQILREEMLIDGEGLPDRDMRLFADLCIARAVYFFNTADASGGPVFFDRSIIDAVTALERMGRAQPRHDRLIARYRYAPDVLFVPPWPELFNSDAERRHGFADAVAEYDALRDSYARKGYRITDVPRLAVTDRADFVEARVAPR